VVTGQDGKTLHIFKKDEDGDMLAVPKEKSRAKKKKGSTPKGIVTKYSKTLR